ncbi:MAG: MFS transporter [Actinomycetota bacterium]
MEESEASGRKASGVSVLAWVLYDFANTIFSVSILTVFFPLWVEEVAGSGALLVNAAIAVSALLVVLTAPALGAIADLRQRRVPYLVVLTLAAVGLTAVLDAGGVAVGLALFVAADLCFQSALVFYNALLPAVSVGRGTGRVSGYGTAAGYVGSILALLVLTPFVSEGETLRELLGPFDGFLETGGERNANAFVPTAVLYLLFSLPAFFLVPDPKVREPRPVSLVAAYRDVISTVRNMRGYAGVGVFMFATLLYMDAANTAVSNMALYGRVVFGMDSGQVRNLLLFSTVFAVVGSAGCGIASDRFGPKKALLGVLLLWVAAISLAVVAVGVWMLYVAGPLVGIALGGTWTVSRAMLVALSPPEKLGEFFGIFSLAGKISAVAGPALTAALLFMLGDLGPTAYRISVGSLVAVMAAGILLLLRVPDARPDPTVERYASEAGPLDSGP